MAPLPHLNFMDTTILPFLTPFDGVDLDWDLYEGGPESLEHIKLDKILCHDQL